MTKHRLTLDRERMPYTPSGYIYLISRNGTNEYKIGISNNWGRRLSELQKIDNAQLTVIHVIETDSTRELEGHLHQLYERERIKGEWFQLSEDDVKSICCIRDGWSGDCIIDIALSKFHGGAI